MIGILIFSHPKHQSRSSIRLQMSSSQKAKVEEIIDTTDHDQPEDTSDLETDNNEPTEDRQVGVPGLMEPSTSSKKKKSKAMKALNALRGKNEVPQAVVNQVMDKVKAEGGQDAAGANEENVRAALEQMKIMNVVQGKAGIGGMNRKDMGEHKVCNAASHLLPRRSHWYAVLGNAACPTIRYEKFRFYLEPILW